MRSGLLFIILLLPFGSYCQKSYVFPEKFSSYYDFHPDDAYELLKKQATKISRSDLDHYVVDFIYAEQNYFDANKVYLDWSEYEVYLNKILKKIVPESKMNIFIERTTVRNAGASGFGNIFLNIGMLNYIDDEAHLAEVIAHETGHVLYDHRDKKLAYKRVMVRTGRTDIIMLDDYLKIGQQHERQADSFALATLKNNKLDFESLIADYDNEEIRRQISKFSLSYSKITKTSSLDPQSLKEKMLKNRDPFASHPSPIERVYWAKRTKENCKECETRYFIDSSLFQRFKKSALEECKKISFETCDYDECIRYSFREYLENPKNLKNLYYLVESIRRLIYMKPELSKAGFLTEKVNDSYLYYNTKSILHKPDYIFETYKQYETLSDHPLFVAEQKPFNTYEEAFLYFAHNAINYNLNEANLSLGLYHHVKKRSDSCIYFLTKYIGNPGINTEFAVNFLKLQKPGIEKGKTLIVYDNLDHLNIYSTTFGNTIYETHIKNYYLARKRKQFNYAIRNILVRDTTKADLVIVNQLLGENPFKLNEMQKLISLASHLYNEKDVRKCKKNRLSSLSVFRKKKVKQRYRKHLLIMAPEWYSWMKTNGYDKLFYVDVNYEYSEPTSEHEYYNTYLGYYLDMNETRPYFKDAIRLGNHRAQSEPVICQKLFSFLYQ